MLGNGISGIRRNGISLRPLYLPFLLCALYTLGMVMALMAPAEMAMNSRGWPFFDPYYSWGTTTETSIEIMGGGRDGGGPDGSAVLTVESPFRKGIHLQVLEALESMELDASAAKLASEGGYVLDELDVPAGVTDEAVLRFVDGSLRGLQHGNNDQSLLSCLAGVLTDLGCNVAALEAWTRKGCRAACLLYVVDSVSGEPVRDPCKRAEIRARAINRDFKKANSMCLSSSNTKEEKRRAGGLLQGWLESLVDLVCHNNSANAYQSGAAADQRSCYSIFQPRQSEGPSVSAGLCKQRNYVEVQVQLRDHPGLLLRSVRALADLGYQIFHASADREYRGQEQLEALELVYVQKLDGSVPSEAECRGLEKDLQDALSDEKKTRRRNVVRHSCCSHEETSLDDELVFWDGDCLAVTLSRGCCSSGNHLLNLLYISKTCASENRAVRDRMEQARWELEARDGLPDPTAAAAAAAACGLPRNSHLRIISRDKERLEAVRAVLRFGDEEYMI